MDTQFIIDLAILTIVTIAGMAIVTAPNKKRKK